MLTDHMSWIVVTATMLFLISALFAWSTGFTADVRGDGNLPVYSGRI